MKKSEFLKLIDKLKRVIISLTKKKRYEDSLNVTALCARLLYEANIVYIDELLEDNLRTISEKLEIKNVFNPDKNTVIFYDGFGLNNRGLAQIYLKALCSFKKVIYVTHKNHINRIPDLQKIVRESENEIRYISGNTKIDQIKELNNIITEYGPKHFIFYTIPDDVVGTVIMYLYSGIITNYQINLTDHAFWLGAEALDICVDFRNYGASISAEYRGINKNKIVCLPYYPIIDEEIAFEGYPFDVKSDQKVIFSGGSLYKTLGDGNKYYDIVDYILRKHNNTIFWYAGNGDATEINKIINRYPGRAYLTNERKDLHQILQHSYFYLSTYPVCGGLMFQYAAKAGKLPVTLKHSNISDDFLLNQESLGIEFSTIDEVYEEIDRLIKDEEYHKKEEQKMLQAVVSAEEFNKTVRELIVGNYKCLQHIKFTHIDTSSFRQIYMDEMTNEKINQLISKKENLFLLKYTPIRFVTGAVFKIIKKYI